jgi:pimeloyl-ACP methyl ester carboxylesterase
MTVFVLVHGAMCGGWVWDDVAARLRAAGHEVHVVDQLPSGGTEPTGLGGLLTDADHLRKLLDEIDAPVVLVGHSYGGMVITEVADHPKVAHTVYLTAVWPQRGQSLLDLYGGVLPRALRQRDDGTIQATNDPVILEQTFARGLDRASAKNLVARLVLQSTASMTTPSTRPDRTHPTTFIIAAEENDAAVAAQEAWAATADHVVRLAGPHMLTLNRADEVAGALGRIDKC